MQADTVLFRVLERKILRKICIWSRQSEGEYKHRTLYDQFYADIDVARSIKVQRLRRLGHVVHMSKDAPIIKSFKYTSEAKHRRKQPKLLWKDQAKDDLTFV